MNFKPGLSLHLRLWVVIALAFVPTFLLALADYGERRREAIARLDEDIAQMLETTHTGESAAVNQVRQILRIMSNADNMRIPEGADCSGLAGRLLRSLPDFANIGAAWPGGDVFCSALPYATPINVADRRWFKEAQTSDGLTDGEFIVGRISKQPGVSFGYPMRDGQGQVRLILFAASKLSWFDQLVSNYRLPEGWEATLITSEGRVISHFPEPEKWRNHVIPAETLAYLQPAYGKDRQIGEMPGIDGIQRMYGMAPLKFSNETIHVVIGAPIDRSLSEVNRAFWIRIGLLSIIVVLSALAARYYIYQLVEIWAGLMSGAVQKIAQGSLDTRIARFTRARELDEVSHGFNAMADALEKREVELRRLSMAVEQSPESIVITDPEARIIFVNQAFLKASGYSREEVIGQNPRILQSGNTPAKTYDQLWETLVAGKIWRGELQNKRKDGSCYVELATIVPIFQNDGRVTHYLAIKEDVTEKKRIAAELEAHRSHLETLVAERTQELAIAKDAAEVANQAKSAFLANMSHEIRTPMNAIIGLTHLVGQSPLNPMQQERLHKISAAARHLLAVINDILDLSKIEAGRLTLDRQPFSPVELMHAIAALVKVTAEAKGLTITVDTDGLPAWAEGDSTRLRQALLNLAGNAVKFTERGSVTLRGEVAAEDEAGWLVTFRVSDSGPGIAAEKLTNLFQPFEQGDNSATRQHGGTGLGLAITRHLARLMGGGVGVESKPGCGSTFWFSARLGRSIEIPPPLTSSLPGPGSAEGLLRRRQPAPRLLLVEDDLVNREVASDLLLAVGIRPDVATDGLEAVSMAGKQGYDLILMDVQMPNLDGLEATRRIRALPGCEKTPIVAMTANTFSDDLAACLSSGMDDFVAKPANPDHLYAVLLRWLPASPAPAEPGPDELVVSSAPPAIDLPTELATLAAYLRQGDIEASSLFRHLRGPLEQRYGTRLAPLRHAIDRLDLEKAAELLDQLTRDSG